MSVRAYLFDAAGEDREVRLAPEVVAKLSERQLLWVDVLGRDQAEVNFLARALNLAPQSVANLMNSADRPHLENYGRYFQIDVKALELGASEMDAAENAPDFGRWVPLDFVAGPNFVVTLHPEPLTFLEEFAAGLRGDTEIGKLSAAAFLAALLDWHITSYFRVIEQLETGVDRLDEEILRHPADREFLNDMALLRRRVGELRRHLTPHREVYSALARPDFVMIASSDSAARFSTLLDRFERAVDATENAREQVLGSFDLYMTATGQRTNDNMKVLTVVTVALGLGALISGIFGMNVSGVPLEKSGVWAFWAILGGIVAVGVGIVLLARRARWL